MRNLAKANSDALCQRSHSIEVNDPRTVPSSKSHAFAALSDLARRCQYKYFLLIELPGFATKMTGDDVILSSFPPHILEDLVAFELLDTWHLISKMRGTSAPFTSRTDGVTCSCDGSCGSEDWPAGATHNADEFLDDHLNIQCVHCLPLATKNHRRIFVLFFLPEPERQTLDPATLFEAQVIFDRMDDTADVKLGRSGEDITRREQECLQWAAAGKTSYEIATIVGLSEHTVNHYLNSCCRKLNCMNRIQAVAEAVRRGLIS